MRELSNRAMLRVRLEIFKTELIGGFKKTLDTPRIGEGIFYMWGWRTLYGFSFLVRFTRVRLGFW